MCFSSRWFYGSGCDVATYPETPSILLFLWSSDKCRPRLQNRVMWLVAKWRCFHHRNQSALVSPVFQPLAFFVSRRLGATGYSLVSFSHCIRVKSTPTATISLLDCPNPRLEVRTNMVTFITGKFHRPTGHPSTLVRRRLNIG